MYHKLMKTIKSFFLLLGIAVLFLNFTPRVSAQGMMGNQYQQSATVDVNQTAQEETEGKSYWDKLQTKQIECKALTDDNYDVLGEYFMGQSIGNSQSHALMNQMMKNMMGDSGETQMHIALGKRLSSCDINAPVPTNGMRFMSMIGFGNSNGISGGGGFSMMGGYGLGNMMNGWGGGFGLFGSLIWILVVVFLILGIIYFWKNINQKK